MISNQLKSILRDRRFKIIRLYMISICCLSLYYYFETSDLLPSLLEETKGTYTQEFKANFVSGLLKYGTLAIGSSIFIILSFILIKERIFKAR